MHIVKIAATARRDIAKVLRYSENEFGLAARDRYKALINQAIQDIAEDAERPGVLQIDEIRKGYFIYHLKMSRGNVIDGRVGKPRHIMLYRFENKNTLIIARLLHDRMLLRRHVNLLPPSE